MQQRYEDLNSGSFLDLDDDGVYVWCGICQKWNARRKKGGFDDGEFLLTEHAWLEHKAYVDIEFAWSSPTERHQAMFNPDTPGIGGAPLEGNVS